MKWRPWPQEFARGEAASSVLCRAVEPGALPLCLALPSSLLTLSKGTEESLVTFSQEIASRGWEIDVHRLRELREGLKLL